MAETAGHYVAPNQNRQRMHAFSPSALLPEKPRSCGVEEQPSSTTLTASPEERGQVPPSLTTTLDFAVPEICSRLTEYAGCDLNRPIGDDDLPDGEHLHWHRKNVFRGGAR